MVQLRDACIRWPSLGCQLIFRTEFSVDDVPALFVIPAQSMSLDIKIEQQKISLCTRVTQERRRALFVCPGCDQNCKRLYLPNKTKEFKCKRCHHLYHASQSTEQIKKKARDVANRPEPPTKLKEPKYLPLWFKWHTVGKGVRRLWKGAPWEVVSK
jgi:hypothetical protein